MSGPPLRLLLVDDHAAFRQPLAFMLEREPDMTVVAQAGTLAEARQILADLQVQGGVDVALVDLQLPDGNGVDVVRDMRALNPHGQALVVTADIDRTHHAQAMAAGASGVISKTAQVADIVAAVRRVHAGEAIQSAQEVIELLRLVGDRQDREQATQLTLGRLTPRERQVLEALVQGLDNKAIADRLFISPETARTHVVKLLAKLNVESRLQAAIYGIQHGIGSTD